MKPLSNLPPLGCLLGLMMDHWIALQLTTYQTNLFKTYALNNIRTAIHCGDPGLF